MSRRGDPAPGSPQPWLGLGAAAEEEGVAGGDRVTGRAPAWLHAALTRGTLFEQQGIFLGSIRAIFLNSCFLSA